MSKIIAMLITVSTLFLPSIIQAKPISIKVAYENNPGEPLENPWMWSCVTGQTY